MLRSRTFAKLKGHIARAIFKVQSHGQAARRVHHGRAVVRSGAIDG